MSNPAPPEGFEALHIDLWVREAHCNARRVVHGGLFCALADNSMGNSMHQLVKTKGIDAGIRGGVTVGLTLDYLGSAQNDQSLEFRSTVLKLGSWLVLTREYLRHVVACSPAQALNLFRVP